MSPCALRLRRNPTERNFGLRKFCRPARRHIELEVREIAGATARTDRLMPKNIRTTLHIVDVSNRDAVFALAQDIESMHGHCEIVFNNAGVAGAFAFDEVELEQFDRIVNIDLGGEVNVARAFLPLLKKSSQAALVNTASLFGLHGYIGSTAYCVAKFGVTGLSQVLSMEASLFYP